MMSNLTLLPLRSAVLCVNCDWISNARGSYCPACGSPSLMTLSTILNRTVAPEVERAMEVVACA